MDRTFEAFCNRVLVDLWRENPVEATFLGVHDHDGSLGSYSGEAVEDYVARRRRYRDEMRGFRERGVPLMQEEEEDNLELLEDKFAVEEQWFADFELHLKDPILYLDTIMDGLFVHIIRDSLPVERRISHIESRLREVPRFLQEATANLRRKPKEVPAVWVGMAGEHATAGLSFIANSIPKFAAQLPGGRAGLNSAAQAASASIRSFQSFIESDIAPRARGRFQTGEERFDLLIRRRLRLRQSRSELLTLAEKAAAQTLEEMRRIARELRGTEDWVEVVEELRADHPSEGELLKVYSAEIAKLKEFIRNRDLVTIPPEEKLTVIETPSYMRSLIPYAAYIPPGPFEEALNGYFMVTLPGKDTPDDERRENLMGHNARGIPVTSLHEGYPGHHLQLAVSNRVTRGIRKIFASDLFAEGWALYCEEMMSEQGYYTDPGTRLMQLKDLLWRACRVVIDVRLHSGDLDIPGAIDMLVDVAKLERSNAVAEVKRYTRSPSQPLTYLIGKLEILRLREETKAREGASFSLKSFHDRLLSFGTIPLSLVARRIAEAGG